MKSYRKKSIPNNDLIISKDKSSSFRHPFLEKASIKSRVSSNYNSESEKKKDFRLRISFQDYKDLNDIVKHIKDNKISDLALLLVLNKFVFYCFLIFCICLNFVCFILCPLLIIELNDL